MTLKRIFVSYSADCADPSCSGHGFCVEGVCVCRKGWRGSNCDQLDHEARQCLPDCSGHGDFDLDTQKCVCKGQWTGRDCSKGKQRKIDATSFPRKIFSLFLQYLHPQSSPAVVAEWAKALPLIQVESHGRSQV